MKNAINSLKLIQSENGVRNPKVKLNTTLRPLYYDANDNFCFEDVYFEEVNTIESSSVNPNSDELLLKIRRLETQVSSNESERMIRVDKFDTKQNATEWIDELENQMQKHNIFDLDKKLRVLKNVISDNVLDWYLTNVKVLKDKPWNEWRNSFINIYGKQSWCNLN